jgi:hypothetical protein
MIAMEDGSLRLNSGFNARKIAELSGVVHGNMDQAQKLAAMYSYGLRFSPIPLLGADHFKSTPDHAGRLGLPRATNLEEADFAIGSILQWSLIERHYRKVTNRGLSLPEKGEVPLFATYYEGDKVWQPISRWEEDTPMPNLRLELGQLVASKELVDQARSRLEQIAEEGTPIGKSLIVTPGLAQHYLELMTLPTPLDAIEIQVSDTRTRLAA